ncbi:sensor histidine kinase [Methanoregula sp. UBA64]|uniref:sensor histidine kinase n=1 Tax=Methanoregula sp. UBA64 TaxID=1915554 RepID=UPI0025DF1231|nr:PAS domain-containing sensor histidine kinase [Methanoregula sp. UBA64]
MADHTPRQRTGTPDRDNLVRGSLIALFVVLVTCSAIAAFPLGLDNLVAQLYYIPLIYAVYAYPRRGMVVSGICACAYEIAGYFYYFPDVAKLLEVTVQAVIFVGITVIIAIQLGRINREKEQYRTVFEYSQLGIVMFDGAGGTIRRYNPKFAGMLQFSDEELLSMTFSDILFSPGEVERFQDRIAKEPVSSDFETRLKTRSGAPCWVSLSWSPLDKTTTSCTAVNINSRKLAEKSVNESMTRYRQLTENSPVGILIVQKGLIRYVNPAFGRFVGVPQREIQGKEFCGFVAGHERLTCREHLDAWEKQHAGSVVSVLSFQTASGEACRTEITTTPITHLGQPATLINVLDTSEKQRLEAKIELDNERRRGILATVAHELRTPLQPIIGYLDLLLADPKDWGISDEARKVLERCLTSADRERQIINRMLDLSVLDSGKIQLTFAPVPLAGLVRSVIETSGYAAQAAIDVSVPDDVVVRADAPRLFIVLDSVISNAIRYSVPPRQIGISWRTDSTDTFWHISVSDNGEGIPADAQESIFEPFQLPDAGQLSRKFDRIGLSLAIAKKIIDAHGGEITVESTVGTGSTFTLHIPKNPPEPGRP